MRFINTGRIHKKIYESKKKVKFLKTHNSLITAFGNDFTSPKYSLGVIYIIRDPRNVITSVKNHNDFETYEKALEFMQNENTVISDYKHLKNFAKTNISTNVKFKSIILFNADKLTIDAQSALRRCIEKFSCSTRFFIVVEDKNKLLKPILSRFCNIYIPLPNIDCEFQSLHNYNRKNIQGNQSLKKHYTTLIKLIKRRDNFSSIENCNNLTEKIYQRGYSALDIMKIIENDSKVSKKEKYTALIYFDKIRKEFRNEKLLMLNFIIILSLTRKSIFFRLSEIIPCLLLSKANFLNACSGLFSGKSRVVKYE